MYLKPVVTRELEFDKKTLFIAGYCEVIVTLTNGANKSSLPAVGR